MAHPARHRDTTHPVWGFLFTYYSLRPGPLRVWHPGYGVTLLGSAAETYLNRSGYDEKPGGVAVSADRLRTRLPAVRFVAGLLRSTAARPPAFGCFGMHEWAMVFRSPQPRHGGVPLRLGPAGTDRVVESMPLRCTHFDAFRFFTPQAVDRNEVRPTRATQGDWEQPGCLHAAMDLYKWAGKLLPLVDSAVLMDTLELAARARELDMRASPYDLSDYGFEPITVEEPAGRAHYVRIQSALAEAAAGLRATLLQRCERLLADPAAQSVLEAAPQCGGQWGEGARIGSGDSSQGGTT